MTEKTEATISLNKNQKKFLETPVGELLEIFSNTVSIERVIEVKTILRDLVETNNVTGMELFCCCAVLGVAQLEKTNI